MNENQPNYPTPFEPPRKKSKSKLVAIVIVIILAIFVIIGVAGNAANSSSANDAGQNNAENVQPTSQGDTAETATEDAADTGTAKEDQVVALGTPVDTGDFQITVNGSYTTGEIKTANGYLSYTPDPGDEYIVVNITIENNSNSTKGFNNSNFQLYTLDQDTQYSPSSLVDSGSGEKYIWMDSLNPGSYITGNVVYSVAQGQDLSQLQVRYRDSGLFGDYRYFAIQ